jgi:hypothetical protein
MHGLKFAGGFHVVEKKLIVVTSSECSLIRVPPIVSVPSNTRLAEQEASSILPSME